jgi:hypothetical protein
MYVLRPLVYKTGIYRSYKIVLAKKKLNHVGFVRMKFCSFNNFTNFTTSKVLYLKYGYPQLKYMKISGFLGSNKVAGNALGNAFGINYISYNYIKRKRREYARENKKR